MRYSKIVATGSYLPAKTLTNQELETMVETNNDWIIERTGIHVRHIASNIETTSMMAHTAALDALNNSQFEPSAIDMVIVATSTPDSIFPSVSCIVQNKLGIKTKGSFDLQAACSGFVYAITTADCYIRAGMAETILVIGVDRMSQIVDYTDRATCILFGDGAGAAILTKSDIPGIIANEIRADGAYNSILTCSGHLSMGKVSGYPYVKMDGRAVFKFAVRGMSSLAREILEKNGYTTDDLSLVVAHQANLRILESIARSLNLPMSKLVTTVANHANTSAASVALALDDANSKMQIKAQDLVLFLAAGAGFSWGASLIRF